MWIRDRDEGLLNLSCITRIIVRELDGGGYILTAWSPDHEYYLGTYDTEKQAKDRICEIMQELKTAGQFIDL